MPAFEKTRPFKGLTVWVKVNWFFNELIERFDGVGSRMICLLGLGVNLGGCGFARVQK